MIINNKDEIRRKRLNAHMNYSANKIDMTSLAMLHIIQHMEGPHLFKKKKGFKGKL